MYKILPFAFFIAMLTKITSVAQISISQDDFPRPAGFVDSAYVVLDTTVAVPAGGENQTWDYSSLPVDIFGTREYFDATADEDFPDALNYTEANFDFILREFPYTVNSNIYDAVDENGWFRTGRSMDSYILPLTPLTGGPDDKLEYFAGKMDYEGRVNLMQFPLTYEDQWEGSYYFDVNYEITAEAYGLVEAPAFTRGIRTENREVIGYGSLIIPDGQGGVTPPMEVLLIKALVSDTDSIFLHNEPAPPALLEAFDIPQGATTQDSFYVFYKPGFESPVLILEYASTDQIAKTTYRPQAADFASAIHSLNLTKTSHFPNPVSPGSTVQISIERLHITSGSISVFDTQGRELTTDSFTGIPGQTISLKLPENISSQLLIYQIIDENKKPVAIGKIEVF